MNADFCTYVHLHQLGDSATHPIEPRCGALAALLLVAGWLCGKGGQRRLAEKDAISCGRICEAGY